MLLCTKIRSIASTARPSTRLQCTNFFSTSASDTVVEVEKLRKMCKWRSMERGMVENELVLRQFVARHLDTMPQEQLELYSTFLDEADPDIFMWITKRLEWPEEYKELGKEITHVANTLVPAHKE